MKTLKDFTSENVNVSELMTAKQMNETTGGKEIEMCTGGMCTGGMCTGGMCTGGWLSCETNTSAFL